MAITDAGSYQANAALAPLAAKTDTPLTATRVAAWRS
jgi:hypothetical protein